MSKNRVLSWQSPGFLWNDHVIKNYSMNGLVSNVFDGNHWKQNILNIFRVEFSNWWITPIRSLNSLGAMVLTRVSGTYISLHEKPWVILPEKVHRGPLEWSPKWEVKIYFGNSISWYRDFHPNFMIIHLLLTIRSTWKHFVDSF